MRNLFLAGAAMLAFSVPAAAQDATPAEAMAEAYVITDAQQAMYDGWTVENRTMYDAWPNDVKVYYWTLAPEQTEGWWVLNDEQRMRIYAMTPEQRTAAWTSIAAQLDGTATAAAPAPAGTMPMAASGSTNMTFVSGEMIQPIPGDTPTSTGDLPVCTPNQQDGCINSWEKNKTGTRPLNYWPGKPASEIDTPLPAEDPND